MEQDQEQEASNENATEQAANAETQTTNVNAALLTGNAVSVLGDAEGGDAEQSIENESVNRASNENDTVQVNDQNQEQCA